MDNIFFTKDIFKQLLLIWIITHALLLFMDIILLLFKIEIMPVNIWGILFFHIGFPVYGLFLDARFSRYVESNYPEIFIRCSSGFQFDIAGNRRLKKHAKELKAIDDSIVKTYLKNCNSALAIVILNFVLFIAVFFIHYGLLVPYFTKLVH